MLAAPSLPALPFFARTPANKLTASDAQNDDKFGYSVSATDRVLVVGAVVEDGTGTDRGAVYVYDRQSGTEIYKLTAADAENDDHFGHSVAVSGDLIVVGARWEDGAGTKRGAAYVFDLQTGIELHKLTASDGEDDDNFGYSVAISGRYVLVGAPGEDGAGIGDARRGAAYFFDLGSPVSPGPGLLNENRKVVPTDTADGMAFGRSVAVSGQHGVVGANEADGGGVDRGAAYVYDLETGEEIYLLSASDAQDNDVLGWSVSMVGDIVLAGSHGEDGAGVGNALRGAAYLFDLSMPVVPDSAFPNRIHETRKLTASDPADNVRFGWSVALSEELAVIGAIEDNGAGVDRGAVYVYELDSGEEIAKFSAADAEDDDNLGWSIAVRGRHVYAGAQQANLGGSNRGAVYAFFAPDHQPDNIIGPAPYTGAGRGVYNSNGASQSFAQTSIGLRPARAWLTVKNDGDAVDSFRLSGNPGNRDFAKTYSRRSLGRTINVTAAIVAGTYRENNLSPDASGRLVMVEVRPTSALKVKAKGKGKKGTRHRILRKTHRTTIRTVSENRPSKRDVAVFSVLAR